MDVIDDNLSEDRVITHKLKGLFISTVVLYSLYLVITLLNFPTQMEMIDKINEIMKNGNPTPEEMLKVMSEGIGYGGLLLILQISAIVCYCIWFFRALENTRLIGYNLPYSSGWSVGSIFVPFVNLFVPFKAFQGLLKGSSKFKDENGKEPITFFIWWAIKVLAFVALIFFAYKGFKLQLQIQMIAENGDLNSVLGSFDEYVKNQKMQIYVGMSTLILIPLFIHNMQIVTKRQGEI
jgi:hypothetical protein